MTSRPVWGAWIEITAETMTDEHHESRAPYGARGLKFGISLVVVGRVSRRAPYGARGLKLGYVGNICTTISRAPYGARGLKYVKQNWMRGPECRAPYGARGLKLHLAPLVRFRPPVAPRMGRVD